ncbi:hypothetical protein QQF64_003425 [Cirrhinus molitorella]|uniref:Uncharacterized protein n=1 Tax=Cirrhinus molitorella TaxID=172907 RepID=A0ABR3ML88_9TELE
MQGRLNLQEVKEVCTHLEKPWKRSTYLENSLLDGLNQAFTRALEADNYPETRILAPDKSELLYMQYMQRRMQVQEGRM